MSTALPLRFAAACGAAATAMITATPALAQQMGYEERVYEYAQPLPRTEPQPVFVRQPVVQSVPQPSYPSAPNGYEYEVDYTQAAPVATHGPAGMMHQPHQAHPHPHHQPQPASYHPQPGYPPMPPVVDRKAWISDCRAYLRERRRRADAGAVGGGLLGAAAGAVIGNEVAKAGDKLGGALIGGGVGGLVGLFIGQAIALAGGDGTKKDCKRWLRTYEESYANGGGRWPYPVHYGNQGWSGWHGGQWGGQWAGQWSQWSAWQGGYVIIPQTTVVVHHQPYVPLVREVVTEKWVEEKVYVHKPVKPHYKPTKKVRYIKQKTKPIRYIKGK